MESSTTPLAERAEIHKSCKALESVVNILNDYCEAANAIVQLQKKLAKALREVASSKCVAQIPANALNASAAILEAMSEVDTKFAKYADKECDAVSADVKKWFKKLAKEERAHDEKIASANLKIKQAGQIYERKAKKNPREAAEEHTRYINLLSTLGPEINREKYNHALFVTERHSSTIYSLAASFSRVAEAEWGRGCESVRRFSPTVGPLGQWRALCEGAWSGALPPDLPEPDHVKDQDGLLSAFAQDSGRMDPTDVTSPPDKSAPEYTSRDPFEQGSSRAMTPGQSPHPPPQYFPPTPNVEQSSEGGLFSREPAKEAMSGHQAALIQDERKSQSTTLASLAAFPAPPTHVPHPTISGSKLSDSLDITPSRDVRPELSQESPTTAASTPFRRLTESPAPEDSRTPTVVDDSHSPSASYDEQFAQASAKLSADPPSIKHREQTPNLAFDISRHPDPTSSHSPTSSPIACHGQSETTRRPPSSPTVSTSTHSPAADVPHRRDSMDETEFGMRRNADVTQVRAVDSTLPKIVERNDTGKSNGSMVAALRDRYSRSGEPTSPPPRELPRLPTSVSSLAHKYEPTSATAYASRQGTGPSVQEKRSGTSSNMAAPHYTSVPPTPTSEEIALRRQRIEELEELELREREHELRMKEREIEQRALELERERQRLLTARTGRDDGGRNLTSRAVDGERRISITHRPSLDNSPGARYPSPYSQSTGNLAPPAATSNGAGTRQPSSQPSSPEALPNDHAPYCGCDSCSASKYKTRDMAQRRDSRPPEPPLILRPEKPRGGWIRRLSMPVVSNAFSIDSRKNASNVALPGGPGYRNSLALAQEDGRLYTDLTGGIRNRSSTNLGRR